MQSTRVPAAVLWYTLEAQRAVTQSMQVAAVPDLLHSTQWDSECVRAIIQVNCSKLPMQSLRKTKQNVSTMLVRKTSIDIVTMEPDLLNCTGEKKHMVNVFSQTLYFL